MKIDISWKSFFSSEMQKEYFSSIVDFLNEEDKKGIVIFPKRENIFRAFEKTPKQKIKAVIIGQDPYHGIGQADGLCFSVRTGIKRPPSLQNIINELVDDIGCKVPKNGSLDAWAENGVFLLNSILTVQEGKPLSHSGIGWEQFTENTILEISKVESPVVFICWGKKASDIVEKNKGSKFPRMIIKSPHPSPLSSHRGFFGSKPFSRSNEFLLKNNSEPIDWNL